MQLLIQSARNLSQCRFLTFERFVVRNYWFTVPVICRSEFDSSFLTFERFSYEGRPMPPQKQSHLTCSRYPPNNQSILNPHPESKVADRGIPPHLIPLTPQPHTHTHTHTHSHTHTHTPLQCPTDPKYVNSQRHIQGCCVHGPRRV